jgi:imidazolonepropionase-like amidohydrolase
MRQVLAGGRVFDALTGKLVDADVAFEDGTIVEVGPGLDGDEVVRVPGLTLLPGLFDLHVHVYISDIDMQRSLYTPFSYRFYEAARNLEATLRSGITTVRDACGADLGMKKAVDDGLVNGPRMQISIRVISQTGGTGDEWLPYGERSHWFYPPEYPGAPQAIVDGPEAIRQKVRELIRNGADVIKIATSGAVLSTADTPYRVHFQPDEIEMAVREAAANGRYVMAHALSTEGIKNAVRAGVRSIEHGTHLDDEAIQLMLEHGTYLVPTLIADPGILRASNEGLTFSEERLRIAEGVIAAGQESFRKAVAAGVKIAMGSDTCITPHGENLDELTLMHQHGLGAPETLQASTIHAAECMGLEGELGSLEPGKRADVVLVEGDPFEFEGLRERISAVYKDGRCVHRAEVAADAFSG